MLSTLLGVTGIVLTIFFVVGTHEAGHFFMARWLGVKVLRFSIGFGKKLLSWHDKSGTEYVIALIPLGGYVKMLDETEGDVQVSELAQAYNRQPIYKKSLIIAAGPFINILCAFMLYWLIYVIGFVTIKPIIGHVAPNSIAAQSGIQSNTIITHIDDHQTLAWQNVLLRFLAHIGNNDNMQITTQTLQRTQTKTHTLNLANWKMDELTPDPLSAIGIKPAEPSMPLIIGTMSAQSPAKAAGLMIGDKIQSVANKPIESWSELIALIQKNPGQTFNLEIKRDRTVLTIPITIATQKHWLTKNTGYLGIGPKPFKLPDDWLQQIQYQPLPAIQHAAQEVHDLVYFNLLILGKMLTGKLSLQSLGGPITIFESAGVSLNQGLIPFLSFLAFLSLSIGVINILPIPGLDGGHLLIQSIEAILRRPIPERYVALLFRLGFIFLFVILIQSLINDVLRIYSA